MRRRAVECQIGGQIAPSVHCRHAVVGTRPADLSNQNDVDRLCRFRECERRQDVFAQLAQASVPPGPDQRLPAAVAVDGDQIAAFLDVAEPVGPLAASVAAPVDPIAASGAAAAAAASVAELVAEPAYSIAAFADAGSEAFAVVVEVLASAPVCSTAASVGAASAAFAVAAFEAPAFAFAAFAAAPVASSEAAAAAFAVELVAAVAVELVAVAVARRLAYRLLRHVLSPERQCRLHRRLKASKSRKK